MSVTLDEFIESITTSGLMDSEEIQSFITTLPMEQQPRTAEDLAKELYRLGKLTKFQAQAIYQKKTRGLVVGNYVVLDKLGKGGMGAVYKARPDRSAAEWVLSIGGTIGLAGAPDKKIATAAELPSAPFQLAWVNLSNRKNVTDAEFAKGINHLPLLENMKELNLNDTLVGDEHGSLPLS